MRVVRWSGMGIVTLSNPRERMGSAAAALALTGALGVLLTLGLAVQPGGAATDAAMALFQVAPDAPQQVETARAPERNRRPEGAAAPPNLRSRATEIVAPVPLVPVVLPPTLPVSEVAADGADTRSGAAEVAGPGTGAGGVGVGTGAGGSGDGDGAGDPDQTPPRWLRGEIRDADIPDALAENGVGGRVTVLYRVEPNGRVSECDIVRSSGTPELDLLTCRLIRERFRFRPSLSGAGKPVAAWIEENHAWTFE